MTQKIILIIVALIILVTGVFYYKETRTKNSNKDSNLSLNNSTDFSQIAKTPSGTIFYIEQKDNVKNILAYNLENNQTKTVFTDKDEDYKLDTFGGFSYLSQNFLSFVKKNNSGQLITVNLTDSNKKVLIDNFTQPESLVISPDGGTIFYSNSVSVNGDNQHFLYEMSVSGKNLRQIYSSSVPIVGLSVNKNTDKIAFIQNSNSIIVLDVNSLAQKEIFRGTNIYSLSWNENGNLIFNTSKGDKLTSGIIYTCNSTGGNLKKVLETNKDFPDFPKLPSDFSGTVYILKNFSANYDMNTSGDIYFSKIGDNKINKIGSGSYLIGWTL